MLSEIKQIPIQWLLDHLWVKYKKVGNTLELFDWTEKTKWWKASISQNIVSAFSKERAHWNPIDFYMQFTWCTLKDALNFFETKYNIKNEKEYRPYLKRPLQNSKEESLEYLRSRWIDPEKVKWKIEYWMHSISRLWADNLRQVVKLYMKDLITGEIVWDNKRTIWAEKIFETEWNDWFFYSILPEVKKSITITEWMFDYLTIAQFTDNVLWMKSCDRNWTQDEKDYLNSFDQVKILLDNDEAGRKWVKKMLEFLTTNVFTINFKDGEKDINEVIMRRDNNTFLAYIKENTIEIKRKPFTHISYKEKIDRAFTELFNTNPDEVIKWWWEEWDSKMWWIYWGKIYAIWWESGKWKSTFINQVCMNIQDQGVRVVKYSLEDRMEDVGKEELYYWINRERFKKWLQKYEWTKFTNNEYWTKTSKYYDPIFWDQMEQARANFSDYTILELDKDQQAWIQDLRRLMEEECRNWAKVFMIDHLHYFKMSGKERTDLEIQDIMHQINEIARKYNVAIFLVAHYKQTKKDILMNDYFKDSTAIKQVANYILHITKDQSVIEDVTIFKITKARWPIKEFDIHSRFDIWTFEYKFFEPEIRKNNSNY